MEKLYLSDIFYRVIVESGQYLLPIENVELDQDKFRVLVEKALATYNKYCPRDTHNDIYVSSPRTYTYSTDIPEEVLAVTPIRVYAVNPLWVNNLSNRYTQNPNLEEVHECPFAYYAPKLTLPYAGNFRVHELHDWVILEETDDDGAIDFYVPYMTIKETYFIDHVKGMFIQGLGRSRRAFTLQDLPVDMDASELVSEGQEIAEGAIEAMVERSHKFSLAYGGGA